MKPKLRLFVYVVYSTYNFTKNLEQCHRSSLDNSGSNFCFQTYLLEYSHLELWRLRYRWRTLLVWLYRYFFLSKFRKKFILWMQRFHVRPLVVLLTIVHFRMTFPLMRYKIRLWFSIFPLSREGILCYRIFQQRAEFFPPFLTVYSMWGVLLLFLNTFLGLFCRFGFLKKITHNLCSIFNHHHCSHLGRGYLRICKYLCFYVQVL